MNRRSTLKAYSFSHKNTSLENRDALAFSTEDVARFVAAVREELDSGASLTEAITAMQTDYIRHSQRGEPFADW